MPKKLTTEIVFSKNIEGPVLLEIMDYIEEYLCTFKDSWIKKCYEEVLVKKVLDKRIYEIFHKRTEAITLDEIRNPEKEYIPKYVKLLVIMKNFIHFSLNDLTPWSKEDEEIMRNMIDFYVKNNYLTEKQQRLIRLKTRMVPLMPLSPEFLLFEEEAKKIVLERFDPDSFIIKEVTDLTRMIKKDRQSEKEINFPEDFNQPGKKELKKVGFLSINKIRSFLAEN